jgi:hypothetical protein
MTNSEFRRASIAAGVLMGTVKARALDGETITVLVVNRDGGEVVTDDYGLTLDALCGGTDVNRVIDSISGKRAQFIGAEDTTTGRLICRLCHLKQPAPFGQRFDALTSKELQCAVDTAGQEHCDLCGRRLV